jgi:hypothetical protein
MKLISISGCGHSGTTLTATVLGTHSKLLLIPVETRMFIDKNYDIDNFLLNNVQKNHIGFIEKTPNHIYVIDKIEKIYTDAYFISNIRDPRDIAASMYKRFNNWETVINRIKKDFEYVYKFIDKTYLIKYEDIVYDFENTFKNVCSHIDLDFEKEMNNYYLYAPNWFNVDNPRETDGSDANHEARRAWQVKQPLFNGTGRWKKELSTSQVDDIVKNVGEISNLLGYEL